MELLKIGQRVTHFGGGPDTHGKGTIVAYNGVKPNAYVEENPGEAVKAVNQVEDPILKGALLDTVVSSFYHGGRCPYVVHWDPRNDDSEIGKKYPNGYRDVYEPDSIREIPGEFKEVVAAM
ncbi:hypothetical protein [Burkholderia phage FLC9]|nr:hypothetical protein [Burkholderia phage FLC9]